MTFFHRLEKLKLAPSWTLVKIGCAFIDYEYRIKKDEILDYVTLLLTKEEQNTMLVDLLLSADDTQEMNKLIDSLSRCERVNYDIENRKWILFVVSSAIEKLSSVPSNEELFRLEDLWGYLGYPEHYPWDVRKNEYIKCRDIDQMIQVHKEWISKEIAALQIAEQ